MAITDPRDADELSPKYLWQPWFAWRPVRLTPYNQWVWLRIVYRRAKFKTYITYDSWQSHEYTDILGILQLPPRPPHQRY